MAFPPPGITTLHNIIKAYIYIQYADDEDVKAFFTAYTQMAQEVLDALNALNLPVYTDTQITGDLLDWVIQGIYGFPRPSLPAARLVQVGPLNTVVINTIPINSLVLEDPFGGSPQYYATSDDTYRRILTWLFFKGDGKVFNIRWLKRRVMRFLFGANGIDYGVSETYRVSVTFGPDGLVNINVLSHLRTVTGGAMPGAFALNTMAFNQLDSFDTVYQPIPEGPVLRAAIESGAVELPFQFTYDVGL